jgi:hypothetical protein
MIVKVAELMMYALRSIAPRASICIYIRSSSR